MRARTLFSFLLVFAFAWLVYSTLAMNQDVVEIRLTFVEPVTLQLGMAILASFLVGVAVVLFFDIIGGARRVALDWRARRRHRAHEKAEDLYLQGLDDMVNGRYEESLARFDEVLKREPDHLNALIKRGDSLRMLQRYRLAAEALDRAVRAVPENLVALYSLSDVYLEMGNQERAEEVLRRILELDPDSTVSAHRKLRDLKVGQRDWRAADELQQKIEKMVTIADEKVLEKDTAIGLRFELARDQAVRGETREAIRSFESVLERDDRFVPAYKELGETLLTLGETEQALTMWHRGYEVTASTELLSAVQNYHLKVDEPEEAIGVWKQALMLSENEAPLRYCLGKLYYRLFMLDEALKEFRLIEDNLSNLPALHLYIARILENQGDLQGALAKTKLILGDVGGLMMDYSCAECKKLFPEWKDWCDRCKKWNTIALDVRAAAAPEPTIRPAPTWSIP